MSGSRSPFSLRSRRREKLVAGARIPDHIRRGVIRTYPSIGSEGWEEVEEGLREWFVCCVWARRRRQLGMPSRAVDEAWHQMILDSAAYMEFCGRAFGRYLHHTPDDRLTTPPQELLANTVHAWDRSVAGRRRESVLWDLDRRLGIPDALGVEGVNLVAVRAAPVGGEPRGAGPWLGDWLGDWGGDGGGGCGGGCGGG
jgi:hypothetical protein